MGSFLARCWPPSHDGWPSRLQERGFSTVAKWVIDLFRCLSLHATIVSRVPRKRRLRFPTPTSTSGKHSFTTSRNQPTAVELTFLAPPPDRYGGGNGSSVVARREQQAAAHQRLAGGEPKRRAVGAGRRRRRRSAGRLGWSGGGRGGRGRRRRRGTRGLERGDRDGAVRGLAEGAFRAG